MGILVVARDYLLWHYTTALADIFFIWRNMMWAVGHMFSVQEVLLTLFSPFKRLQEEAPNPLADFQGFLGGLVVNILMRIVGFIIRSALLFIAFGVWAILIVFGTALFLVWFLLPYLLLIIFTTALSAAFS